MLVDSTHWIGLTVALQCPLLQGPYFVAFILRSYPRSSYVCFQSHSFPSSCALHVFMSTSHPLSAPFLNYTHLPFSFICSTVSISLLTSMFFCCCRLYPPRLAAALLVCFSLAPNWTSVAFGENRSLLFLNDLLSYWCQQTKLDVSVFPLVSSEICFRKSWYVTRN